MGDCRLHWFGFYAAVARIDEVVIARGELKGMGAERPIKAHLSGVVSEHSRQRGGTRQPRSGADSIRLRSKQ